MNMKKVLIFFSLLSIYVGLQACNLPGSPSTTETPFLFPTVNLTKTALFNQGLSATGTNTTIAKIFTATPSIPTASPTPTLSSTPSPTEKPPQPSVTSSATPSPTISYSGPGMRSGVGLAAEFLEEPPKINGDFSDWDLPIYPASHVVYGGGNRNDDADLSSTIMVAWDEDFLYLGARVKDEKYVQNSTNELIYRGDSIEILLDIEVANDYYFDSLNEDDYQLGISPGSPTKGKNTESYLWYPREYEGPIADVEIGILGLPKGYHIEVAIPWSVFSVTPYVGQHFGFVFSVSDNDKSNENIQQSMISNVPSRLLTDPMTWGDLTLTRQK